MVHEPVTLENDHWQTGILPLTGASIAFGRVRQGEQWLDVMRPTNPADYGNSSKCSSFIMLPWCNRIKDGVLHFQGAEYQLETTLDDGTARHGDVRKRTWTVDEQTDTLIRLSLDSRDQINVNYPFAFAASAEYWLDGRAFVWKLTLTNVDVSPMPGGFGHHPYFVRPSGDNTPILTIPCDSQFELQNSMAVAAPVAIHPELDFRQPRSIGDARFDHLLTGRQGSDPARLRYPAWGIDLVMEADPIFQQFILYAPGDASVAVEPMTNANDGFNLYERGITESGVFVLQPGESVSGEVRLTLEN
jgi:aldose 1-epimerase